MKKYIDYVKDKCVELLFILLVILLSPLLLIVWIFWRKKVEDWIISTLKAFGCSFFITLYESFIGKNKTDEAEKRRNILEQKNDEEYAHYEKMMGSIDEKIQKVISEINKNREYVKEELFPTTVKLLETFKESGEKKAYKHEQMNVIIQQKDEVKSKNELFKIDFENSPLWNKPLVVIAFAPYTRWRARKTLQNVEKEEERMEKVRKENKERYLSDKVKYTKIEESYSQSLKFYKQIISIFEHMQQRLENDVLFCRLFMKDKTEGVIEIDMLPTEYQNDVFCICNMLNLLKKITEETTDVENETSVEQYKEKQESTLAEMKKQMAI